MSPRKSKKAKKRSELEDESLKLLPVRYILKRLFQYIGAGNRKYIIPFIIVVALHILFSVFNPLIFKEFVDVGLSGGFGKNTMEGNIDYIVFLGTLFFVLTIAGVITRVIQGYIIQKIATITMYNLRYELFIKFQKLGLDYHENPKRTAGKKISYLTNDVNTLQELIQSGLLAVIGNIFLIFGSLAFMIMLSPQLTLISFMIAPCIFIIAGLIFKRARKYYKELRERVALVTSKLDESIMGMRIIQSFAVEEETLKEFEEATRNEMTTSLKSAKLFAVIPGTLMVIITIGLGLLFLTAGILIREGSITQGTFVAFIFYIFMFFEPLIQVTTFFTMFQNSYAALTRIVNIIDEKPSIEEKPDAIKFDTIKGKIDYKNVSFQYDTGVPVLKNISLTIKEKERLAIVGYTGAGKSTFIKLLCRFYDPTEGEIKVDGVNLKDIKLASLRQRMGIVLQENFLFSGSIMENIRYGKLNATNEEVIEAAKKVNAHKFIIELEKGYETEVGERGGHLSEGQRQLIAFARALIADPPILILDEATSSVDPYSELLIQQALETLLKGRTSISIAHRLSTILNSDRIIVLDKGQIIEQGSHQELVQKENGFYKHLYQMQFKDPFKKEEAEKEDLDLKAFKRGDLFDEQEKHSRFM